MIKNLLQTFQPFSDTTSEKGLSNLTESFAYLLNNIESKRKERSEKHILSKAYYDYWLNAKAIKKKVSIVHFAGIDIEVDEWQTFRPKAFSDTIAGQKERYPLGTKKEPLSRQSYKISITSESSLKNKTATRYYAKCNCADFKHVFGPKLEELGYSLPVEGFESIDEPVSEDAKSAAQEQIGICKHIYAIMKQPQYAKYLGETSDSSPLVNINSAMPKTTLHPGISWEPEEEPDEQEAYSSYKYEEPEQEPEEVIPPEPLLKQRARDHIKRNLEQVITALNNAYGRGDRDLYIRYSGSKTQYKKYLFTVSQINLDVSYLKFPPAGYSGKINVISYSSQKLESKYKGTVKIPSMSFAGKSYGALDLYALFTPLELIDIVKQIKTHSEMPQTLQQQLGKSNIPITEAIFEDLTLEGISFNFLIEDIIREYNGNHIN